MKESKQAQVMAALTRLYDLAEARARIHELDMYLGDGTARADFAQLDARIEHCRAELREVSNG